MATKMMALAALLGLSSAAAAGPFLIDFDTDALGNAIPEGTTISTQYQAWGAVFIPNILDPAGGWASNTDMTATAIDVGNGYLPAMGNVLHAVGNVYDGWLAEDGDPNFAIFFSDALASFSITFVGDSSGNSGIAGFDADGAFVFFEGVTGGNINGKTITLDAATLQGVTTIAAVLPGDFNDWVAVSEVSFSLVPTPGTAAMAGLGLLAASRRRRA